MPEELIELSGHIIDSLILPRVLTEIMERGGNFDVEEFRMGKRKTETSYARIRVFADTEALLADILDSVQGLGALVAHDREAKWAEAPMDGVFPEDFYSTTNLTTHVFFGGQWREVTDPEMDCGIRLDSETGDARTIPIGEVKKGDKFVVGHDGIRVVALERSREREIFEFMGSGVSSEKPKGELIKKIAGEMVAARQGGMKILVVAGPAVIHTGAGKYLSRIIDMGFVNVLFSGNALAVHDIEYALYGTSLGFYLDRGVSAAGGHEHHLRAINTVRRLGGIRNAVEQGVLTSGVMYSLVKNRVPFVLAGSIRDDGPLPDVITDSQQAQAEMRRLSRGVGLAVMVASTLHSVATGNLLPAYVRTVAVDINPAVATKLSDRGSFQALGIVTDSESFLRELSRALRDLTSSTHGRKVKP
jgi:lysine-ketoglutarate reductase/saccharopine dehydrogenase-like protein (TIGR00300 family)